MFLRSGRRWLTATGLHTARAAAPLLPVGLIDFAQWWMTRAGPTWPVLSGMVAANMRAAGLYDRLRFRAYFEQVALHLSNALRIFRLARRPEAIADLARSQVEVDVSVARIHEASKLGRGVVLAPAHVCNYVFTLARLNQETPIRVYLRWSEDERKIEMKRTWCDVTGLQVILEPASAADPTSRAAACVEALREGATLVMTPDIAQKHDKGVPVRLLGREVYLPTGPASIALLAEAPLVPVFGRLVRGRHVICAEEPILIPPLSRAEGGRQEAVRRAMQAWTDRFESFLRACPEAWFLWADSRWTRVFRGDRRYCRMSGELSSESTS